MSRSFQISVINEISNNTLPAMEISKAMEISMGLNFGYPMEFSMGHGNFHGGPYFKFQDHGNFHGVGNFHGGPYFTSDGR